MQMNHMGHLTLQHQLSLWLILVCLITIFCQPCGDEEIGIFTSWPIIVPYSCITSVVIYHCATLVNQIVKNTQER